VLSQRQMIDWMTVEVEPVISAKLGCATVEYSRTMRKFGQDDEVVTRGYTTFSPFAGQTFPYGVTSENFTQIDRLKIASPIGQCNQFYGIAYVGDTENEFRDTHRNFHGYDLRLTNYAIDRVTLTAYAKQHNEDNQLPPFLLPEETDPTLLRHPINYDRMWAGVRGKWHPHFDPCDRLFFTGRPSAKKPSFSRTQRAT
jgi:hypothetical protein